MPFQSGNQCGKHNNHARGFKCRNLNQLKNMRWVRKGDASVRVSVNELELFLSQGWECGRTSPNEETRALQSKAQKARRYPRLSDSPDYGRHREYACRYKRTLEDFNNTLKSQGGHCALCPSTGSVKRRLCWDHDHACCPGRSCGKCVRGLLCIACNKLLGHFEVFLKNGAFITKSGTWENSAMNYIMKYSFTA